MSGGCVFLSMRMLFRTHPVRLTADGVGPVVQVTAPESVINGLWGEQYTCAW